MSVGLTELGGQEGLDQVPSHRRSDCPTTHANNIHMIVLDPLPGREMIVDQRGANARNLAGTHRCSHAAAADCHATFDLPRRYSPGERGDKVRIVVVRAQAIRAEIYDLVSGRAELATSCSFKPKPP
jgi:hypothetical protein